jgi:outer membrane protein TolC
MPFFIVLENIQAQQDLTQARSEYLTALAEYNKAQYGLNKAVGGPPELLQAQGAMPRIEAAPARGSQ